MPVIPPKTKRDGFDAGSQSDRIRGSWWLQVKADDYLVRGYGEMGFYGKLKMLLKEKGVTDCEWSYAYLVTAPRFLGYSFNPVSFWYIYDQSDQLNKMILEVNNTFGERRVYVLDGTSPATSLVSGSGALESDVGKLQFTDVWLKDFHVSPFNSRKGSYSLKALNPFPADVFTSPIIDNTITQKSSKAHAKIVARVYSTHQPLDPATLGIFGITKFALGWWWVGLSTFPRILKEAKTLYFRRQLNVWYRPEVLTSSISRIPTSTEMVLQEIFENYLKQLVWNAVEPLHVTYHTSIPSHPKEEIATMCTPGRDIPLKRIELRVLTPIFYSRFVHYAHTSEAFDREYLFTDEKNRTIWISNPELLHLLLPNRNTPTSEPESLGRQMSYLNELRWMLLRKLRCPPAESAYPTKPKPPSFEISNKPSLPFSDLDLFQRGPHGRLDSGIYRRTVMQVFLAQRLAFGFVEVVNGVDFLLRTLLCYIGARMLTTWALEAQANGFNRRLKLVEGTCIAELIGANTGRWWLFGLGLWVCSCNLYGLAKG
ncbi:uncharacterized protein BDR25DRAFT_213802 [Lindgomyces ingoldianus]|uniref:Uncharacterized protein n=1 Tax=Lindgomyces ingoldianus TaxID=673940 RepID=A0ACB6RAZ6_9PLEO|nr:uncharacterized protein BDR25DRAFT_213802 [Lindgomyces ingoldianus]KAF2475520.1 hypothetical protein BDR25DRAFT_213802 [Lindgomyces ingoldianus]